MKADVLGADGKRFGDPIRQKKARMGNPARLESLARPSVLYPRDVGGRLRNSPGGVPHARGLM